MTRIGILGGGQLGRMLLQAGANYTAETFLMEKDPNCPASHLCHHFIQGDIQNFEDVYRFGKNLDAITIEIEAVNVEALEKLQSEGVRVYPNPSVLATIKNKIRQKKYYTDIQVPTAPFVVTENLEELKSEVHRLPAAHKIALGGYDGRGVTILKEASDISKGFDAPSVLESLVKIKKEISLIVAATQDFSYSLYPAVEMIFNQDLNLLQYQICPAGLDQKTLWKAEAIALTVVKNFKSPGIFAVEMFVDLEDNVWVNETAPRVHNSGHHTIEAHYSSQFDMLWRIMLHYPPGNTQYILPSAMVNLIGADGHSGPAVYEGIEDVLKMENSFVHLYGKSQTRPGRKMGHVTLMSENHQDLVHKANLIHRTLLVKSANS